jgi:hypothetical protein
VNAERTIKPAAPSLQPRDRARRMKGMRRIRKMDKRFGIMKPKKVLKKPNTLLP